MYTRCVFFRFRPELTTIVDNDNDYDDDDDCLTNYCNIRFGYQDRQTKSHTDTH